jgi:hypothetical protein
VNSEKGVSEGNKGGGCNIVGARSGEGLARGYSPWSHKEKESSVRLVLMNRCCQAPESGVASSLNLQVTSRGPVCVY